jgi:hypothetical protein
VDPEEQFGWREGSAFWNVNVRRQIDAAFEQIIAVLSQLLNVLRQDEPPNDQKPFPPKADVLLHAQSVLRDFGPRVRRDFYHCPDYRKQKQI